MLTSRFGKAIVIAVANITMMVTAFKLLNRDNVDYNQYLFYFFITLGGANIILTVYAIYKRFWLIAAIAAVFTVVNWLIIESGSG
jgi:hypothetical protein